MSENDHLRLNETFYLRKYKPRAHSIPEKNVLTSQTFYFILENILKRF